MCLWSWREGELAVGFAGAAELVGRSWSQMSIKITIKICIAEAENFV